jgi:hypothetical protein
MLVKAKIRLSTQFSKSRYNAYRGLSFQNDNHHSLWFYYSTIQYNLQGFSIADGHNTFVVNS